MNRLILQIIAGILGIFLGIRFVPGVSLETGFTASWQYLLLIGSVLGLINFFLKPILKMITLPLRMLTFGLFGLVINMAMVWIVDILFPELIISGIVPLFLITLIIWGVSLILGLYKPGRKIIE